jgi:hypothetical protein
VQLQEWTRDLAGRGITVTAPTTTVPVDLWALTLDGLALHLRCRGRRVRLSVWAAAALRRAVPGPVVDLPGHPARDERLVGVHEAPEAPLVVPSGVEPGRVVEIDGTERFGWTGIEAGRLTVGEVAGLLDELLVEAGLVTAAVAA